MPAAVPTASADPLSIRTDPGTITGAGGVVVPGTTEVYVLRWDEETGEWELQRSQGLRRRPGTLCGERAGRGHLPAHVRASGPRLALGVVARRSHFRDRNRPRARRRRAAHRGGRRAAAGRPHHRHGAPSGRLAPRPRSSRSPGPPTTVRRTATAAAAAPSGRVQYQIARLEPGTYRVQIIDGQRGAAQRVLERRAHVRAGDGQSSSASARPSRWATAFSASPPRRRWRRAVLVANTAKPTIAGRPVVGRRLTAKAGTWTPAGVTYAYQWFAGGKAIKGATTAKLKLTKAQRGKKITVQVTASAPARTRRRRPAKPPRRSPKPKK